MTEKEANIWTITIEKILSDNQSWSDKNDSDRYHVLWNDMKMPPKVVLGRAMNHIRETYPEVKIPKVGGGVPTNQFIEGFGFIITEDLIYKSSDFKKLDKFFANVNDLKLVKDFINHAHKVVKSNNLEPYKVRMAVKLKEIFMVIGMRDVMSFKIVDGKSHIGLLLSKSLTEKVILQDNYVRTYDYKGQPLQNLVRFNVEHFSDISGDILNHHIEQVNLQYNHIKNSKRTQWNVEAKTTNNALKYMVFENDTSDKFIQHNKEDNMRYFLGGAYWDSSNPKDQTQRFLKDGTWINGYEDKFNDIVNDIPDNSLIAIKSVDRKNDSLILKAIGQVVKNEKDGQNLSVKWQNNFKKFRLPFSGGYWDTITEVTKKNHIRKIFHREDTSKDASSEYKAIDDIQPKLNQILYGPPGTGKTYSTITEAVKIIAPDFYDTNRDNREEIVSYYRENLITNWSEPKGQIAFCTFHQAFTYEDFVEGIKPDIVDEKHIIYSIQKGIFKSLCDRARTSTTGKGDFDAVINQMQNDILEDGIITLSTNRGNLFDVNYTGQTTFRIRPHESSAENPQYPAAIENIRMLYEGAPLTEVYNPSYVKGILEYLYSNYDLQPYQQIKNNNKPYVIIIDEINRGNVASIFGELITLIELDKRLGAKEELSVILPYSKKEFSVPKNVHIIGTMNTADRSIEALDSALRRRFSFTEVQPSPSIIADVLQEKSHWNGIDLIEVLDKINKRIAILIDRDHKIGHSYFLKLKNLKSTEFSRGLRHVFSDNIIPLLQEYFFSDYIKIGMVLGKSFIEALPQNDALFAEIDNTLSEDYSDTLEYEFVNLELLSDSEFKSALETLLNA